MERIPAEGPLIIAANHVSYLDPPALGAAVPPVRPVRFMAKEELFRIPFLGRMIAACGAFPVKRGTADRRALKQALAYLAQGEVLGIFPEGRRVMTGELGEAEQGVALIALKSSAPILPAAIMGTRPLYRFRGILPSLSRIRVRFGTPFLPDAVLDPSLKGRGRLEALSRKIMDEIRSLQH
ncbi:MAG: 1-acyl-sn-glycerol-3-phosphate acyltransferase [Armatimonadetes bacterium]|nr:1-acyl-sn-glycerol-3-phosphate acyltransferase [Armatimonadota bacterium]